ncbi:Myb-like domain [Phytophthora cactorum]|nr:Myb-like domain [Phytophthora cactorum]
MGRSASAPLHTRSRSRYSSVLESALVGLGREDAVVRSTRKPRKKRRYDASQSPIRGLAKALSAPEQRSQAAAEEEEDPFACLKLLKSQKKNKKRREETRKSEEEASSPAVTRSASKLKKRHKRLHAGVLEMAGNTPVTRSMSMKKAKRSSLEMIEDTEQEPEEEDVVIQKKLLFSPEPKKKKEGVVLKNWRVVWPPMLEPDSERAEMIVMGQVGGESALFVVGKREGAAKFTAKDGTYVALSGKLDRDAARSAGIPRAAMRLMEDGIPTFFYKRLLPFVQKSQKTEKRKSVAVRNLAKKKTRNRCERQKSIEHCGACLADESVREILLEFSSPMPPIDEEADLSTEEPVASPSIQEGDLYETPKPKKVRNGDGSSPASEQKKSAKTDQPEPEAEADAWTNEQLEALMDAKLQIPTTASNFWAQVAQYVPGKSAQDCQAKTFEQFRSPPTKRKAAKKPLKRVNADANSAIPTKIARAGSNKFKKQVREFVEEYEKKHADDLFDTTPSKEGLPELPEFDAIKSPEMATRSHSVADDDSDIDDEAPGLLKKISSRRRDDIDSYVLGINRQHVASGGVMVRGKVRRVTSMATPVKAATSCAKKKAVMLVEDVGSHCVRGVVSPGGTTHVRIEKDGSSSEGEDEDSYHSSEEEEDFDIH